MGKNFAKLKKKARRNAILKSVLFGLAFGGFAAGVSLLALKLSAVSLAFWYYIIIGVGAALLAGGLTFLLFRKSDKQLAKSLDDEYGLGERVQTSLAFEGAEGAVIEAQRADTEAYLGALPKYSFGKWLKRNFSQLWKFAVVLILAPAIVVSAVFVPLRVREGGAIGGETEVDTPYILSEEELILLSDVITNVKKTELDDELKESVVKLLNRLMNNLFVVEWSSDMRKLVSDTATKIDQLFTEKLSYTRIANALSEFNQYQFSVVIANGARVYRSHKLVDFAEVQAFLETGAAEATEAIQEGLDVVYEALEEDIGSTAAEIYSALSLSKISATDKLYSLFFDIAKIIAKDEKINGAKTQLELALPQELARQGYVRAVKCYTLINLGEIFGVDVPDDADFIPTNRSSSDDGNDDNKTNDGGYGPGSWKLDYTLYNPNTGNYEHYKDILADYFAIVDAMLRQDGEFTEEQKRVIQSYFEILFKDIEIEE